MPEVGGLMNILEMNEILKVYPNGVVANEKVNFAVRQGEIHALLGENGAGKSTLMKILFGMETPQEGTIFFRGEPVSFHSSRDAIDMGIGMVSQHFMLVPSLSISDNIILGKEILHRGIFLDKKKTKDEIQALANKYNFELRVDDTIGDSSVAVKQKVEILKTLFRKAEVLILDEPTAVLTPLETKELFVQLRLLRDSGKTIIFITHKLDEIGELCDRLTIMNHGRSMGTYEARNMSSREIARLMIGRDMEETGPRRTSPRGEVILKLTDLCVPGRGSHDVVKNVNLTLCSGEIVGLVGVEGNGQSELVEAICGLRPLSQGNINFLGQTFTRVNVETMRDLGLAHIPEDRMETGISPSLSIQENFTANQIDSREYSHRGLIHPKAMRLRADSAIERFDIRCSTSKQAIRQLSGGNIQKVIVARELGNNPPMIVANQPTRGIDIGSAEFIRNQLVEAKIRGCTVFLVTADLTEALEISDRIVVLYKGSIAAILQNSSDLTDNELGEYMLGVKKQTPQEWIS